MFAGRTAEKPDPFKFTLQHYGYSESVQFAGYLGYKIEAISDKANATHHYGNFCSRVRSPVKVRTVSSLTSSRPNVRIPRTHILHHLWPAFDQNLPDRFGDSSQHVTVVAHKASHIVCQGGMRAEQVITKRQGRKRIVDFVRQLVDQVVS